MITFDEIVNKLEFNPLDEQTVSDDNFVLSIDDKTPSRFSILTDEESTWLCKYMYKKLYGSE